MKNPLLSTEEKRRWLARVFRDEDGESVSYTHLTLPQIA